MKIIFRKLRKISTIFITVFVVVVFIFSAINADAYVSVKGYYRSNGTYVAPHVRSNPNGLKYDNYGYTPSQGLYNDTYGTRGTDWDTPTYVTDPDYYEGKAIYEGQVLSVQYSESNPYSADNPLKLEEGQLIKNNKFAEVFYVDSGLVLQWIINERAAEKYFGKTWNKVIRNFDTIPRIYKFGNNLQ